jgi:hypothetical protein|tara:strand:+ start:2325 stop:2516 length:192 start_codon:yes stop_codon:yes gene_type:complete
MDIEKAIFISLIFLEEFVKRVLISPLKLYTMYDYWSHNRRVAAAAKYAEENPYTFPKSPLDDD